MICPQPSTAIAVTLVLAGFDRSLVLTLPLTLYSVVREITLNSDFGHSITLPPSTLTTKYTFTHILKIFQYLICDR